MRWFRFAAPAPAQVTMRAQPIVVQHGSHAPDVEQAAYRFNAILRYVERFVAGKKPENFPHLIGEAMQHCGLLVQRGTMSAEEAVTRLTLLLGK